MANQLGMAEQQSILVLAQRGWSYRRIARTLGIHRETVSRHVRLAAEAPVDTTGPPGVPLRTGHEDASSAEPAKPARRYAFLHRHSAKTGRTVETTMA